MESKHKKILYLSIFGAAIASGIAYHYLKNKNKIANNQKTYTLDQLYIDQKELVVENRLQTISLIALFFLGIETVKDIK